MAESSPIERPAGLDEQNGYTLLVPTSYTQGDATVAVDRLQLRRLTGAEMMLLDKPLPYTERLFQLIEAMTGLPRAVTVKFDAVDLNRIDDVFGYFMEPGSVTGAIS